MIQEFLPRVGDNTVNNFQMTEKLNNYKKKYLRRWLGMEIQWVYSNVGVGYPTNIQLQKIMINKKYQKFLRKKYKKNYFINYISTIIMLYKFWWR